MHARLNHFAAAPATMKALLDFSMQIEGQLLEKSLAELVKIRASQLNHCGFCLHMHTTDALKSGETQERLNMIAAWPESPLFTPRERAALAWTDALTLLPNSHAPDDVYEAMAAEFSAEDQVKLTMTIALINAWNRFGAGFRPVHAIHQKRDAA